MMNTAPGSRPIELLVIEDSGADAGLLADVLHQANPNCRLNIVADGDAAMQFLRRQGQFSRAPRPTLVILDLSIPLKSGEEVLSDMKLDDDLRTIPVLVFTATDDPRRIARMYGLSAACYIVKPVGMSELSAKIQAINKFWLNRVKLPSAN